MTIQVRRVVDLDDEQLAQVIDRAAEHRNGDAARTHGGEVVVLAFFESSLRTRLGFASAAHRIGASPIDLVERRASAVAMAESFADTVRTASGYADALVIRSNHDIDEVATLIRPDVALLNAGDHGAASEHPSQALIDIVALEEFAGPLEHAHVAICGDLRMRAVRSLLSVLERRRPAALSLITHDDLGSPPDLPPGLRDITDMRSPWQLDGVDALYVAGIPHGAAGESVRTALRVDAGALRALDARAVVLSPMPIIDEIASGVRSDSRMRYLQQSDQGLYVRMALLELLLGRLR